jgi:hypothetical protein
MKIVRFLGFLLLSEAAAIILFLFCRMVLHLNPFGLNVNLILSVGGLVFGFVGGSGSLPGAKRAGIAPSVPIMGLVALVTGAAVLAYYYAIFAIFVAQLGGAASGIGFGEFLDATVGHTHFSASFASSTSSDIGKWGYGLFMLHIGWAMLTSVWWLTRLRHAAHCSKCECYFEQREQRALLFEDAAQIQELALSLPKASAERAMHLLKMPPTPSYVLAPGVVRLEIRHAQCPGCREHDATEIMEIHNGKGFAEARVSSYRWRESGAYRAAPGGGTPQPAGVTQRVGFGRRGLS